MIALPSVFWSLIPIAMILHGCASPPKPEDIARADFGTPVKQEEGEALAKLFLGVSLKDPDSAKMEWGNIGKAWGRQGIFQGGGYWYGYRLDGLVNAKNGYGGYTGSKPWAFFFRDGKLGLVWDPTLYNSRGEQSGFVSEPSK